MLIIWFSKIYKVFFKREEKTQNFNAKAQRRGKKMGRARCPGYGFRRMLIIWFSKIYKVFFKREEKTQNFNAKAQRRGKKMGRGKMPWLRVSTDAVMQKNLSVNNLMVL
jgi:tetrahydromethanopterin S-methyltransferase subunit G